MVVVISKVASNKIRQFYRNMHKKYRHSWGTEEIHRLIDRTITEMSYIENGLRRTNPTISRWQGFYMAQSRNKRWYFAYRIDGEKAYVEDACYMSGMHESKKVIRLTESELRQIIKNSIRKTLTEDFNNEKTSYQAPPKNNGKLNDWELFNIINSIVKQMIIDKQITPSDGDMLMHYSLYNNDCYGHSFVTSQR